MHAHGRKGATPGVGFTVTNSDVMSCRVCDAVFVDTSQVLQRFSDVIKTAGGPLMMLARLFATTLFHFYEPPSTSVSFLTPYSVAAGAAVSLHPSVMSLRYLIKYCQRVPVLTLY
jgi:hypothetical protein